MLEFVTTGWLKRNLLSVTKLNFKTIFYTDTTYILDIKLAVRYSCYLQQFNPYLVLEMKFQFMIILHSLTFSLLESWLVPLDSLAIVVI